MVLTLKEMLKTAQEPELSDDSRSKTLIVTTSVNYILLNAEKVIVSLSEW
jgi:hypothetical protein